MATPRDPVDAGFNELWKVYPRRFQKPKAKAAYAKIAPNAETHAQMVAAAHALAAHVQANGGDISKCPYPHSWIEGERWDEDPAAGYVEREPKGKAKAKAAVAGTHKPTTAPTKPVADNHESDSGGPVSDAEISRRLERYFKHATTTRDTWNSKGEPDIDDQTLYDCLLSGGLDDWPDHLTPPQWLTEGAAELEREIAARCKVIEIPDPRDWPAWTDDRAWRARVDAARPDGHHCTVLRQWTKAAGGRSDKGAIYIPADLTLGNARSALKDYARVFGMDFHIDANSA